VLIAALLGWMFDGLEMGLFPLIARPALQEMQAVAGGALSDKFVGYWMGIVTAAFLLGAAAGGIAFGWLGDRIGRVRAMSLSILCYSLFTGFVYFAQSPWQLAGLRFVAALGMGGEWALGVALVMEVWPERFRPMLAGFIGMASNIGFALIACVGLFAAVTRDSWRWVALVGAAPAVLTLFILWFVPESERWQAAAKATPTKPLREALTPPLLWTTLLAALLTSVVLIATWGSVQWLPLWADQLTQGTLPKAKAYTQLLSAVGAIVGAWIGGWVGGLVPRRVGYFLLCMISLITCAVLFRGVDHYGTTFLVMTFLAGGASAAFYGWLPLYLPELFPTRVRATAQGFAYNAGRVFAAVGAVQMGALMQTFDGSYAKAGAVITLVYVVGMALIWIAPETKGKPLPE
jgi:MFS family permease